MQARQGVGGYVEVFSQALLACLLIAPRSQVSTTVTRVTAWPAWRHCLASDKPLRSRLSMGWRNLHASLNGRSRGVLPVSLAIALAKAGARGGRPGSPMPVGGSALGTMCTAILGVSGMRATT